MEVTNGFMGLDLVDRVPEELQMEVCNIAHEMVAKKKKEMQQCKVVVWGGFTKAEERREAKGKGEKERYTQLNA